MKWYRKHMLLFSLLVLFAILTIIGLMNFLMIKNGGTTVPVPNIPRGAVTIGQGQQLTYVILGDSTAVGQGGEYKQGIAVLTAEHLASKGRQVTYSNFAISGARVSDVVSVQLEQAKAIKPDVVLIAIGANDVTHLTKMDIVETGMKQIVTTLKQTNPNVKIIITGSPQMGSVPLFLQPTKWLAERQTARINKVFAKIATDQSVTFAHIADETGPIFKKHSEYFAQDKFHPTTEGYLVWMPTLTKALDQAVK